MTEITSSCGTITVLPAFDPEDVSLDCSVPSEATAGDTISVSLTWSNDNDGAVSIDYDVLLNGSPSGSFSATVSGGSTETQSVNIEVMDAGTVSVGVEYSVSEL